MSDEEIYFDNEDDQEQDQQGDEPNPEEEETPETKYENAKGLLGFNDLEAIDIFYEIYCDLSADIKIQGKALKRAAITLSTTDDYERILGALSDVFTAYSEKTIDNALCTKIIRRMMGNIRNEKALTEFLNEAVEKVDRNQQLQLFIDIKIRQSELSLKKHDITLCEEQLSEVEQFVEVSEDCTDRLLLNSRVHVLLLKIELTELTVKNTPDEDIIFEYYRKLKAIPNMVFTQDRQKAVLAKIEGQMALHALDFEKAATLFHEAFKLFDGIGSDKRIDCLPFLALAVMCMKDQKAMIFNNPQIYPFNNLKPYLPLKDLLEPFKNSNYVKYKFFLQDAKDVFIEKIKNAQFYLDLLDKVGNFVLRCNVKVLCPMYKKVEFKFLSEKLQCSTEEVRNIVFDLIISRELNALIDTDSNLILLQEIPQKSIYLQNVELMVDELGDRIRRLTRRESGLRFT